MTRPLSVATQYQQQPRGGVSSSRRSRHVVGSSSKRITIKPFSKPPKLPDNYYKDTSTELLQATRLIYKDVHVTTKLSSPQNSYNAVVNLVSHQYGPRLYQDLQVSMKEAANAILQAPPKDTTTNTLEQDRVEASIKLLSHVQDKYQQYVDYVLLCRHVFLPLDRTHLFLKDGTVVTRSGGIVNHASSGSLQQQQQQQACTLWEVGLQQFHNRMKELNLEVETKQHFWNALWHDYSHNSAHAVDLFLLAKVIKMWQDLQALPEILTWLGVQLERSLQTESTSFKSVEPYAPQRFVIHVESKWHHVSQKWTFLPKTWLRTLIEVKLLEPHLTEGYLFAPHNFKALLEHYPHLMTSLWMLTGRLGAIQKTTTTSKSALVSAICNYTRRKGLAFVLPQSQEQVDQVTKKTMIPSLLKLHSTLSSLQDKLHKGSNELSTPLKNVWDEVMNASSLTAELLAKHVDVQFRNTKQLLDMEVFSNSVLQLFCHLQAKDVFEAFYKRDLAKRLLLSKIVSMDVERNMVTLLKAECGAGYTSKMEGMFQDVEWSRETMSRYKAATAKQAQEQVDVEVQVLTTGYWPVYPQHPNLILPESLKVLQDRFHEHYKTTYQGRRMTWQYALGNCVVKANFPNKKYDLVVSLCQALVLLCFNDTQKSGWTLPEIMAKTGLEDRADVERLLQSLSLGKDGTRVLRKLDYKEPNSPSKSKKIRHAVHDLDVFGFNDQFESHLRRIKINNIQWKETKQERDKTVQGVSRDRLYLIDAVLVRILKARKTILHQLLIPQVLEQVKVPAQPSDIKKRIESLIEREYMERDEHDRNRYNYLA